MTQDARKIQSFTDLVAWQKGHQLVLDVYKSCATFPSTDQYGLGSQLRRAIVSYTSNLAEGFVRSSEREKRQFYSMSLGSITEVQNQLLIARDLGYIQSDEFSRLAERTVELSKLVNGLIRHTTMSRPSRPTSRV